MKDIFSAFESEVFRPLVTVVLPGAIGLSTWVIALLQRWEALRWAAQAKATETLVILVSLAVVAGFIFEDVGSEIERWMDKRCGTAHINNWYEYLRHAFEVEPIGELYIRTLVLRLKFELGTAVALISAAIGTGFVAIPKPVHVWSPLLLVAVGAFLLDQAWESCKALGKVRAELVKGIIKK